ncbi:MAG: hypothetical protein AB8H79_01190 [Myxococcota bacterium]
MSRWIIVACAAAVGAPAAALACGNHVETAVVGWADDGSALVRVQHDDDEGELHELELRLIGDNETKTWKILAPEHDGNRAVRGARWTNAEAELVAMGVSIDPTIKPMADASSVTLSNGLSLFTAEWVYEGGATRHTDLVVSDETKAAPMLSMHGPQPPGIVNAWQHPKGEAMVLGLGFSGDTLVHVTPTKAKAALDTPRTECPEYTTITLVGWGTADEPVFRREVTHYEVRGSDVCSLAIQRVGASGTERFDVVKPGDPDPTAARKQRWPQVEAALTAK